MKKLLFCFTLVLSSLSFAKEVDFSSSAARKEPINHPYRDGDTYKIYTKPLHQTILTFGNDQVEYAETGDNVSFHTIADKHSVRVKVMDENLSTDLVVKTDRGFYYFKVLSTYSNYNPMINFLYPQEEVLKMQRYRQSSEPLNVLNLEELNNAYSISKKYSWTPTQIFDDGTKTYFFMPYKLQEMPAFMIETGDKGDPYIVVSPRVKETEGGMKILVIDRLFEKGVLTLGSKKVIIKNKNYQY